jgi:hypothetical protein
MIRHFLDRLFRLVDVKGRRQLELLEAQYKLEDAARQRELAEANRSSELRELLEVVLTRVQEPQAKQTEALIELAKGIQSHGAALNTWFDLFKNTQGDGSMGYLAEADDAARKAQDERDAADLIAKGYPVGETSPDKVAEFLATAFGGHIG